MVESGGRLEDPPLRVFFFLVGSRDWKKQGVGLRGRGGAGRKAHGVQRPCRSATAEKGAAEKPLSERRLFAFPPLLVRGRSFCLFLEMEDRKGGEILF